MTDIIRIREPFIDDAYLNAMREELSRAWRKHSGYTPAWFGMDNRDRMIILTEEIGEIARALTYDNGDRAKLREELLQTATMAIAWMIGLDEE